MADVIDLDTLFYIDSNGCHVSDYSDFLSYHQEAFKTIYGQDIDLDADTQDGQLVAHFAQASYDIAMKCAQTFNSYSPATASGDALSRQVRLNGIQRLGATNSRADLLITGTAGTGIHNGQAKDQAGNIWNLPELVTIPAERQITVTATAAQEGAITADPGTITRINTPTAGWISVTNLSAATAGRDTETDATLRQRQAVSTAMPSQAPVIGILGALSNLDGVTRVKVYENDTSETDELGIPSHSIAAVVEGGDVNEIAEAIRVKKPAGCGTYGSTVITVTDSRLNPINIRFFRPDIIHIKVHVTLNPLAGYSSTYEDEMRNEILDYINNLGIGATVYLSKLYVPGNIEANDHDSAYDIVSIELAKDEEPYAAQNIQTAFNEVPAIDTEGVEVTVNG